MASSDTLCSLESSNNSESEADIMASSSKKADEEPLLLHPALSSIPMQIRFGFSGVMSNVLFVILYNQAVEKLEHAYPASTIYAVIYFFFIPLGHALTCLLVFGWPAKYVSSLVNNYPIGLTAILLGSTLTAYLDRIGFEGLAKDWVMSNIFSQQPAGHEGNEEMGEFRSSMLVMLVTSIWTYVLSVMVNLPSTKQHKKDL